MAHTVVFGPAWQQTRDYDPMRDTFLVEHRNHQSTSLLMARISHVPSFLWSKLLFAFLQPHMFTCEICHVSQLRILVDSIIPNVNSWKKGNILKMGSISERFRAHHLSIWPTAGLRCVLSFLSLPRTKKSGQVVVFDSEVFFGPCLAIPLLSISHLAKLR